MNLSLRFGALLLASPATLALAQANAPHIPVINAPAQPSRTAPAAAATSTTTTTATSTTTTTTAPRPVHHVHHTVKHEDAATTTVETAEVRMPQPVQSEGSAMIRLPHTDPRISGAVIIPGMTDNDIVAIHTHTAMTTVIMLPPGEKILDFLCGDRSRWVLEGAENFAYLRPAEPGLHTDVNLVTSSGHVYSFDADEDGVRPDLKIIVRGNAKPDLASSSVMPSTKPGGEHPTFVSYDEFQKAQLFAQKTAEIASTEVERDRQNVATAMHFDYEWKQPKKGKTDFEVQAIYHDDAFTYVSVKNDNSEKPALYVIRDGQPELTNYTYRDGIYVVPGVIQKGYLRAGKTKLDFERKGSK